MSRPAGSGRAGSIPGDSPEARAPLQDNRRGQRHGSIRDGVLNRETGRQGGRIGSIGSRGNPDPISLVTAYLYSQFRAGNLATTPQGAADLQNAIWWMEEEITTAQRSVAATTMINNAKTVLGLNALGDTDLRALNANGAYGARVLNVYSNETLTAMNQDMLAMVPEPSTYAAAALLMVPVLVQARRMRRSV